MRGQFLKDQHMFRRAASFALLLTVIGAVPALASGGRDDNGSAPTTVASDTAAPAATELPAWAVDRVEKRPVALSALYGAYGTLQILDMVSTRKAIAAGAHEANPTMGSGSVGRMLAVKAGTGAVSIYLAEKMWKKNRVGAMLMMAAINGTSAAVVAHNTRLARR